MRLVATGTFRRQHTGCMPLVTFGAGRRGGMGRMAGGAAKPAVKRGVGCELLPLVFVAGQAGLGRLFRKGYFAGAVGVGMALETFVLGVVGRSGVTLHAGGNDFPFLRRMSLMAIRAGDLCPVG